MTTLLSPCLSPPRFLLRFRYCHFRGIRCCLVNVNLNVNKLYSRQDFTFQSQPDWRHPRLCSFLLSFCLWAPLPVYTFIHLVVLCNSCSAFKRAAQLGNKYCSSAYSLGSRSSPSEVGYSSHYWAAVQGPHSAGSLPVTVICKVRAWKSIKESLTEIERTNADGTEGHVERNWIRLATGVNLSAYCQSVQLVTRSNVPLVNWSIRFVWRLVSKSIHQSQLPESEKKRKELSRKNSHASGGKWGSGELRVLMQQDSLTCCICICNRALPGASFFSFCSCFISCLAIELSVSFLVLICCATPLTAQ